MYLSQKTFGIRKWEKYDYIFSALTIEIDAGYTVAEADGTAQICFTITATSGSRQFVSCHKMYQNI